MAAAPKDVEFNVNWRPFFLAPADSWDKFGPDARTQGVNKREYYEAKFGRARTEQIVPRMKQAFMEAGCGGEMTMEGMTGPTLDSHRLITLAEKHGLQDAMVEELFKNYFLEGKTICDPEVLVAAGEKVGLPDARSMVEDSQAGLADVTAQLRAGQGVSGVPFFIISRDMQPRPKRITLSGAQPPDLLLEAFEDLYS
eukprot:CAMPEP_0196578422 /NCGR_PEP_ID=MMETSP1081-20130531/7323_1 /TAXON_ID=36882 /ORGANISM="Pyramimonas amylifera, Strain CCMP720" /LENGTH=196 /DNA_ID=CAMNT_0041897629 /DNA_START=268 /DNA_END=858 /DNA_ORIENTATION=+